MIWEYHTKYSLFTWVYINKQLSPMKLHDAAG